MRGHNSKDVLHNKYTATEPTQACTAILTNKKHDKRHLLLMENEIMIVEQHQARGAERHCAYHRNILRFPVDNFVTQTT